MKSEIKIYYVLFFALEVQGEIDTADGSPELCNYAIFAMPMLT